MLTDFHELKFALYNDERDLAMVVSPEKQQVIDDMGDIIHALKLRYFEFPEAYKNDPTRWDNTQAAKDLDKDFLAKTNEDIRKSEAARKQKEANEAQRRKRLADATIALTGALENVQKKRKPSTEFPQGDEGISEERRKLVEKALGIEKQIT